MKRAFLLFACAGASALGAFSAYAADPTFPPISSHAHWHGMWWICPLAFLFMFFFCAVAFSRMRRGRGNGCAPWHGPGARREDEHGGVYESALDILDKRFARGEIDKEDYEERKATLAER